MQSKALQSKILLRMQSEAKHSTAKQCKAKRFKAKQCKAQHKQSKSKAKAMFRELQRASESFRELQRASESSNRRHTKATAKQKQSKSTAHIPFILKPRNFLKCLANLRTAFSKTRWGKCLSCPRVRLFLVTTQRPTALRKLHCASRHPGSTNTGLFSYLF